MGRRLQSGFCSPKSAVASQPVRNSSMFGLLMGSLPSAPELAIALAQASRGSVTALHIAQPRRPRSWSRFGELFEVIGPRWIQFCGKSGSAITICSCSG